jgi:hypothetical protein
MNIAIRGGGSAGLGYFQFWKEISKKDLFFNVFSGCSAGGVMGVPMMSGMTAEQGLDLLKKIQGDKYMTYPNKIKKSFVLFRPFMYLNLIINIRRKFWRSCRDILQFYFPTWNAVNVRCKKSFIGFCDRDKIQKHAGRGFLKAVKKNGLMNTLSEKKATVDPESYLNNVGIYYASDDGMYEYSKRKRCLVKCSDEVIPPWKAVLATFANPAFPDIVFYINGKRVRAWDGGQIDNFAAIPHSGKEYLAISCSKEPGKIGQGIMQTSNYVLELFPPKKYLECLPKKKRPFLDFSDKSLYEAYSLPATDYVI